MTKCDEPKREEESAEGKDTCEASMTSVAANPSEGNRSKTR